MFDSIEKIKLVSVTRQFSRHGAVHTTYPHRIILRLSANLDYVMQNERVRGEPGDTVFLVNSPPYQAFYPNDERGESLMINFTGELPDKSPKAIVLRKNGETARLIEQIYRCWAVQTAANRCRCVGMLWEVLAQFAENSRPEHPHSAGVLEPALRHLEEHIFDPDLRVSELPRLCGISDTYFRRLFEERFGMPPKKYLLHTRLSQAKAILDSGEYDSIGAVAEAVGFEDQLHFSKAYKARYGHSPTSGKPSFAHLPRNPRSPCK